MRISRLVVGLLLTTLAALPAFGGKPSPGGAEGRPVTHEKIEADWLRQDVVRNLPPAAPYNAKTAASQMTTRLDAAGAVDGVKDGRFGFHTERDQNPWWQVDLGGPVEVDRVVVFNRCDGNVEKRAARLKVLLSGNGREWNEVYQHDGTGFFGQTDGKPLTVPAAGQRARFVRLQLPAPEYFHLDEVEVYGVGGEENVALDKPADQSSVSPWSKASEPLDARREPGTVPEDERSYPVAEVVQRGLKLAENLRRLGVEVEADAETLREVARRLEGLADDAPASARGPLYFKARWAVRRMTLANPRLDFDDLLFVKRAPGTFTHMSDQYYGWWSRPGGGLYVLEDFRSEEPKVRCLTSALPEGSVLRPDLSYDGAKVVFAYCKYYPGLRDEPDKLDKSNVPEDAFYHVFEMNVDGTGLRRLTDGRYDDFDARYLPDGRIVFLSTRRGHHVQVRPESAEASAAGQLPDCYVRCGGGPERPVAVYTLHVMNTDGTGLEQISPFEMFEWTPSIDHQGRILYARWDYVDRHNMPYMSLWSTMPDGTNARAVFGNFTTNPHCIFEARSIPHSQKLIFTASGHHAFTGGSLVLLDPNRSADGEAAMRRLTPEVVFPETEGWPQTYFANPYPLSESHYLVAWSDAPLPPGTPRPAWGMPGPANDLGLYLFDRFGNLDLVYRDAEISSMYPLPVRPRPKPRTVSSQVDLAGPQEGRMLLQNVYLGLESIAPTKVKSLRLVGVPQKTHPTMNFPSIGMTRDDPGKFVLGTVPVDADGSAYFQVPSGVSFFLQALNEEGVAVQTMRSATYVQPGQTTTCVGCHERRNTSPPNTQPTAMRRTASKITPGPEGSWPLDFQTLVGPVLQSHCTECHQPSADGEKWDLTPDKSYDTLVAYGSPSLREHVLARYTAGRSIAGACASQASPLVKLLREGHYEVELGSDDWMRLYTWMDTYAQRQGSFGADQEARLVDLRRRMKGMLAE